MNVNWKPLLCALLALGLFSLAGCAAQETPQEEPAPPAQEEPGVVEEPITGAADELLGQLTLEEKVGQLFFVAPEAFASAGSQVTQMDGPALAALQEYSVGGVVLAEKNMTSPDQLTALLDTMKQYSRIPLIFATQEEGGSATQLANPAFALPQTGAMGTIGATGQAAKAKEAGSTIGGYLHKLGFRLNLAPVADANTDPGSTAIGSRAFHSDPEQAAMMVSAAVEGFHEGGVACTLKHFPGLGAAVRDETTGYLTTQKTWDQMRVCELYPFQAGMATGADLVMVAHLATPKATGDGLPASLSQEMITDKLRGELRYRRLVITDAMDQPAITQHYSAGQAALLAFQAGADIILMPQNLSAAYDALLAAVKDGTISQERLDQSVLRILQLKQKYELI